MDAQINFVKDQSGQVAQMIVLQGGWGVPAKRIK